MRTFRAASRHAQIAAALLVGALVASACGSTVGGDTQTVGADTQFEDLAGREPQTAAPQPSPGVEGPPPGPGTADLQPEPGTADPQPGPGTADPQPGRVESDRQQEGQQTAADEQQPRVARGPIPVGSGARGVTDDTILVGMVNIDLDQADAVTSRLGGSGVYEGESTTREIGEAVVAHLNEHGGVAGRQLEIVWHNADVVALVTAEGRRRDAQRACATWTEDNQVFAFLDRSFTSEIYLACAQRNNTVMVPHYGGFAVDEQLYAGMPNLLYSLTRMIAERRDENLVESLVRRGVLDSSSRVGIVVEDWEGARRGVTNGMEPALAAHGIEVAAKAVYPDPIESPWDTYVLQFRSADVTHVLFAQAWNGSGFETLFMMRAAENQLWRPTWGIGSKNRPFRLAQGGAPRAQMANTFVMGWVPRLDVGEYADTQARSRCSQIAGRPLQSVDDFWHTYCDLLFFLQAALERAPEVSPAGMRAGVSALGDSYESIDAIAGRTHFLAGRPDGVALQRDVVYNEDCQDDGTNCWRHTGQALPMR